MFIYDTYVYVCMTYNICEIIVVRIDRCKAASGASDEHPAADTLQ